MNLGTVEVQVPFQLMQPSQINQDHPSMDNLQQLMNAQPMMHHHHHHHVGESNQYLSLNINLQETPAYVHHHSLQSGEDGMNASQSEVQAHTGLGSSHEESSSLREEDGSAHQQQHHLHQCEPHFAFNHDGAGDSINESSQYMENAYLDQKKGQSTLSHSKSCGAENNGNEGTQTTHREKRIREEAKKDKRKRKERKRKRKEREKRNSNHNRRRRTEEVDLLLGAAENGQQHFSEGDHSCTMFLSSFLCFFFIKIC